MAIFDFTKKTGTPWYIAGLAFECSQCGKCCAGPEEGYVWLTDDEARRIAQHLRMSEVDFREKYIRRIGRGQSLVERRPSNDCIFLEKTSQGGRCRIYPVRPVQCGTWPFWRSNIADPYCWALAADRCEGINRGPLVPFEEIEDRANRTPE